MLNKIKNIVANEEGQGMVEYGLILALVAVVVIAALTLLGPKIANVFNNVNNKL
ncbi:MAG: Flp family type IVb pilin [Solirubrobacterales bacterium]